MGVPTPEYKSSILDWVFPWNKPTSYWGTPMISGIPHMASIQLGVPDFTASICVAWALAVEIFTVENFGEFGQQSGRMGISTSNFKLEMESEKVSRTPKKWALFLVGRIFLQKPFRASRFSPWFSMKEALKVMSRPEADSESRFQSSDKVPTRHGIQWESSWCLVDFNRF